MNSAITIGFHSSIESLIEKTEGNLKRVSEYMIIEKNSKHFEKTFVFTSDKKNFQQILPKNCFHVPLGGRLRYILFGWLVMLKYVSKYKIPIIFVEGSTALPSVFLLNKIKKTITFLN